MFLVSSTSENKYILTHQITMGQYKAKLLIHDWKETAISKSRLANELVIIDCYCCGICKLQAIKYLSHQRFTDSDQWHKIMHILPVRCTVGIQEYIPISFVNLVTKTNSINNCKLQVHVTFLQLCTCLWKTDAVKNHADINHYRNARPRV